MTKEEKVAVERYNNGELHSVSTFIDDDTIIAGYGKLDYDFEFPLPYDLIKKIYGTNSWTQHLKNKSLNRYKTINDKGEVSITPYLTNQQLESLKKDNPKYTIIEI